MANKANNKLPELRGSVVYQPYDIRFDGSAAVKPVPVALPEERIAPRKQKVPKAKVSVSPLAVVGTMIVIALLAMVVYSYVQLYETTNQVGELRAELTEKQENTAKLQSAYEGMINLDEIEKRVRENYGMTQPSARQIFYLNVPGADHAEVLQVDDRSFLEKAWDAIDGSFHGIMEYFH